jgi:hypothetical protein
MQYYLIASCQSIPLWSSHNLFIRQFSEIGRKKGHLQYGITQKGSAVCQGTYPIFQLQLRTATDNL